MPNFHSDSFDPREGKAMAVTCFALGQHSKNGAQDAVTFALATPLADVRMPNVRRGIDNIVAFANGRQICELTLLDHGYANAGYPSGPSLAFGDDEVAKGDFDVYALQFARLTKVLSPTAIVNFRHCNAATFTDLMMRFAKCFDRRVRGWTGATHPLLIGTANFGREQVFRPDGK